MFVYIALHLVFGLVAGVTFAYMKSVGLRDKAKAWVAYIIGMTICLATAGLIGELSKRWHVADLYVWIGVAVMILAFSGTVFLRVRSQRRS
jgi:peptidoglycan/LPS O-acetylase OafA/YrhL